MDRTMRAVVYQGPYDVAIEEVDDPEIEHPNDVVIDITTSCICGSDLHMYGANRGRGGNRVRPREYGDRERSR